MTADCRACGAPYKKGVDIDPCLREFPAPVVSACCGHGNPEHALVIFGDPPDRTSLKGPSASAWFEAQGVQPSWLS